MGTAQKEERISLIPRSKLPKLVYCPYHGCMVRGCEHRDEGMLNEK